MRTKTILCFLLLLSVLTAQAQQAPEIIYNQPEGTLRIYERQGKTVYENEDYALETGDQGGRLNIVYAADGLTVYVQGLVSKDISNSWVRGTLSQDGVTLTIPTDQYVDYTRTFDMAYQLKMVTWDGEQQTYVPDAATTAVTMTVGDDGTLTLNGTDGQHLLGLVIRTFGNPQGSAIGQTFDYLNNQWIGYGDYATVYTPTGEQPQQAPEGLETATYYMTSAEYDGANYSSFARTVSVGTTGSDVWVKGLCKYLPEAWVKGTLADDGCYHVASGQFLGAYADYPLYLLGAHMDSWGLTAKDIVLQPADGRLVTYDYLVVSISQTDIEGVNIYMGATFSTEPDAVVELPAGLQGEPCTMTYRSTASGREQNLALTMAREGDDLYLQGIWPNLPEAWVKGHIDGSTVTFATSQYLGGYFDDETGSTFDIYFSAFDGQTGQMLPELTFSYDRETGILSNASSPVCIGINKTGYLSVQDYHALVITPDSQSGIAAVPADTRKRFEVFNLAGQRVQNPARGGVYIVNGKKTVVK